MLLRILIIIAFVIVFLWYLKEKIHAYSIKAVFLKAIVTVLCILLAVYNAFADPDTGAFAAFVVIGLVFGLLGDIALDLKYVYPKDDKIYTYAGFCVFAVGHFFYMAGILQYHTGSWLYVVIPVTLAVIVGIANGFMEKMMKLEYGSFKPIVMVYGAILFAMMLLAISVAAENHFGNLRMNLFALGGISFTLSDLVLSGTYFGEGKERPVDLICNYIFYYLAQFLIAMTLI